MVTAASVSLGKEVASGTETGDAYQEKLLAEEKSRRHYKSSVIMILWAGLR